VAAELAAAPVGAGGRLPRLWLVTRGARSLAPDEVPDLAQAGVRGLARTLVLEHPALRTTLIDLDPEGHDGAYLPAELTAGQDDEVAWRGDTRRVARLTRAAARPHPAPRPMVRPGGGYIVTGGLSGVGLYTAGRLAAEGAGCVVLNARSAPDPQALAAIEHMRASGAHVLVVRGDIAEPGTAEHLVAQVAAGGYPLSGVVHSAMTLDDCLVADLDADRLNRVWRPKAAGAWRLHRATRDTALDWWVCYSSIASLIGGAGQANYASANAFVDSLAEWRAARGLPALSVNWGGWAQIGRARDLTHDAFPMMPPPEGMAALAELIGRGVRGAAAMRLDPEALVRTVPETTRSSFFRPIVDAVRSADDLGTDPQALRALPPERLREVVAERLRERIGQILGYRGADLSRRTALTRLGLDSLMAVKTKNAVLADFGVVVAVARLLQGISLGELEDRIVGELGGEPEPQTPPPAVARAQARAQARLSARTQQRRNR
ncbi:beta-ketoacyl reductase, partial [Streptomyces sp. SID3343]|uniref:beta-ketoacyl reductase n=1 Tax=Streptomyces sp. SID3343 TaxID=2690260 RepID=UPI00136D30CD